MKTKLAKISLSDLNKKDVWDIKRTEQFYAIDRRTKEEMVIDKNNNIIVPLCDDIDNPLGKVYVYRKGLLKGIIDTKGKEILPLEYNIDVNFGRPFDYLLCKKRYSYEDIKIFSLEDMNFIELKTVYNNKDILKFEGKYIWEDYIFIKKSEKIMTLKEYQKMNNRNDDEDYYSSNDDEEKDETPCHHYGFSAGFNGYCPEEEDFSRYYWF